MSTRKTKIEIEFVRKFLAKNFSKDVSGLIQLIGGEMSCPFAFSVGVKKYIIRVDSHMRSYLKDKYAWKNFSASRIPIPEFVKAGKIDDKYYFAITNKIEGRTYDFLSKEEKLRIVPSLFSVLMEIHKTDITDTKNYGYWDSSGNAKHERWKEYLLSINNGIDAWLKIHADKFSNDGIFDKTYDAILSLVKYCPENRYLIHGDYGFNNIISDGTSIIGVLDWGESRYGDFIFDIAWLDAWQEEIKYENIFKKYYDDYKISIPSYKERILCYKLHIYYGSLIFEIESQQYENATWTKNKLEQLLQNLSI